MSLLIDEKPDPNAQWIRDAKWGLFTHYLAHVASDPDSVIPKKEWIKKVNSFDVKHLGDQLTALKVPYFFITVGQHANCFCSPNKAFDKHFGINTGVRTERDLVADLAAELVPRGIKMCVYTVSYGIFSYLHYYKAGENIPEWLDVLTEWSERWGKSISAWWADAGATLGYEEYMAYINAYKAGNKDALVATKLWRGLPLEQVREDYTGGESGFLLEVTNDRYHNYRKGVTDRIPLHFLTFMGEFWGVGEPRFPVEVVTGWTQHVNNLGGTVSWDIPLTDSGAIPDDFYEYLVKLRSKV